MEFEVLGTKLRLRPDENNGNIPAVRIVDLVNNEAKEIKKNSPHLENSQIAVLVALKLASDKLELGKEYQENIDKLSNTAKDALRFIEEVSPA